MGTLTAWLEDNPGYSVTFQSQRDGLVLVTMRTGKIVYGRSEHPHFLESGDVLDILLDHMRETIDEYVKEQANG